jgi:acyl carrier protein
MAVEIQQIKDQLREFIVKSFLPGEDPANLREDMPLRSSGIIDSLSTLKLVTFVEETYGIEVNPHDASTHFDRIEDIAELVARGTDG